MTWNFHENPCFIVCGEGKKLDINFSRISPNTLNGKKTWRNRREREKALLNYEKELNHHGILKDGNVSEKTGKHFKRNPWLDFLYFVRNHNICVWCTPNFIYCLFVSCHELGIYRLRRRKIWEIQDTQSLLVNKKEKLVHAIF